MIIFYSLNNLHTEISLYFMKETIIVRVFKWAIYEYRNVK